LNLAILAERNLERFGEYDALIFDDRPIKNAEQLRAASRLAHALVELGVPPGDRVAVMLSNRPDVYHAYGAVQAARGGALRLVVAEVPDRQDAEKGASRAAGPDCRCTGRREPRPSGIIGSGPARRRRDDPIGRMT
jgi:acyl-coenzyme A synthetase/AMP-(fatty) acid ligase